MKKSWVWISAGLLTIIIVVAGLSLWRGFSTKAESLSKKEAEKLIETRYKGKVTQIILNGAQYVAQMTRNDSIYEIKLDSNSGKVVSMDVKGQIKTQPDHPPIGGEERPEPQQPANGNEADSIITQEDAVQIALQQVSGKVDKVELETEDSFSYYLVKIETTDKREAVIQIHVISGEVLSLSWHD
jgi:uncharacterized membrane protein YkoI